jgi:hypothetical protein
MRTRRYLAVIVAWFPLVWLFAIGCAPNTKTRLTKSGGVQDPLVVSARLREIATSGALTDLRWSNFSDCSEQVQRLYKAATSQYGPAIGGQHRRRSH